MLHKHTYNWAIRISGINHQVLIISKQKCSK